MPSQRSSSPVAAANRSGLGGVALPSREDRAVFPLTSAQKCLCASEPSGLGAIVARHWEQAVWGDFSPSRLHRAAEIVAQRYPPVRLQLESGGQQRLAASFPLPLVRVSDACTLDEAAQRTLLASERDRMCTNEAGRLTNAWQIHVLRTNQETAVVTACFSRLFFDRCTIRQVLDALLRAYRAPTEELGAPLSIESFRAWSIAAQATDEERTEPTAETLPGPELPMIAAPSPPVAPRHTRVTIRIPGSVWADVKTNLLAEAREASLAALIGAGCGSALAMWAKQSRFAVQWWNEDRLLPGVPPESSGQFSRVSLATIDETENRAFSQRVVAMQRSLDEGTSAAQSVAFASATQASLPVVSFAPWFPRHPIQDTGPERSDQFVFVGASRPGVVLEFHSEETPERALILSIDFVREVFPPGVVESLAGALERWWHALGAGREAWKASPLEQAARLFPAAQARDRQAFNATQGPLTEDLLFSGFLRQLPQARNRTAIISPERKLTYGQLHGYAGRLALELQARGIRRNELVAVAMDKGWEQIAAAIGITLAGGAYLPVDIDLPAERIRFLVEYGAARVVVTQSTRASGLPLPAGVATIALDTLAPLEPDAPLPAANVAPDDLAYVIFTSGSTGMPKGVMIDHRGAVNTIADMNNRFGVRPDDRVLALSRLSFDLSVYDIFGLLAAGGTIVVPAPDLARDPAHWADLVRTHRVTIWNTVPALMQLLVDFAADRPDELGKSLRLVWMSGDWIPLPLPERIWRLLPGAQITSLGGATEASIWSILFPITAVDPDWRSIPYGRPMMNQTFHVLHENLAPCPDHVTGELFIGGVGVARGYWKDEYKTRARFITHPLSGDRLYRTGDLGRFLPDGYIEFLGRSDFQVKIRGFRIELGEIETALTAHHQVRIAVVVARGDTDSTRQLVAYVVAKDVAPAAAELQAFLRRRLPDYMVPAAFVLLERLPLTANGKVDVKALPAPATAAPDDPGRPPPAEPTNEIEEIILSLWRQILGIARVGIHDDFFSLGGTSLSGTRLVIRLREAFALPLPVQSLFENPTIHRLAAVIEASLLADVGQEERRTS